MLPSTLYMLFIVYLYHIYFPIGHKFHERVINEKIRNISGSCNKLSLITEQDLRKRSMKALFSKSPPAGRTGATAEIWIRIILLY